RLYVALPAAVPLLVWLAALGGAPYGAALAVAAAGLAAAAIALVALRARRQARLDAAAAKRQSHAEIEAIADRMWELQENEERFRGLIDALGDLVVHRDRSGRIIYANKV